MVNKLEMKSKGILTLAAAASVFHEWHHWIVRQIAEWLLFYSTVGNHGYCGDAGWEGVNYLATKIES